MKQGPPSKNTTHRPSWLSWPLRSRSLDPASRLSNWKRLYPPSSTTAAYEEPSLVLGVSSFQKFQAGRRSSICPLRRRHPPLPGLSRLIWFQELAWTCTLCEAPSTPVLRKDQTNRPRKAAGRANRRHMRAHATDFKHNEQRLALGHSSAALRWCAGRLGLGRPHCARLAGMYHLYIIYSSGPTSSALG